jgi:hypothetical protein
MPRLTLLVAGGLLLSANLAFAQQSTPDPDLEKYKAETDRIVAETARKKAEQDSSKQEKQSEIDRLTAEKDLLDVENATEASKRKDALDKLKAQKDLIDAAALKVEGAPEGKVTYDDKGASAIENTVMAYETVNALAKPIADAVVKGHAEETYIIIGSGDRSSLTALPVFEGQADLLTKRLNDVNAMKDKDGLAYPKADSEASSFGLTDLTTAGAFINAAASLVSLFRVDDTFVVKDETPDARAVYSVIAREITANKGAVYYPDAMAPSLFDDLTNSKVHQKLTGIVTALDGLWSTYFLRMADNERAAKAADEAEGKIASSEKAVKEIATLKTERARPTTSAARRKEIDQLIEEKQKAVLDDTLLNDLRKSAAALRAYLEANKKYIALLDRVLKSGDDYIAAMTTAGTATTAPITALISAERLRALYTAHPDKTWAIEVGVVRLAGTRKEHRNFFGTNVKFSGGVVVSYRVFNAKTGQMVASDTLSQVSPLTKLEKK